jgi:hypothetical protein
MDLMFTILMAAMVLWGADAETARRYAGAISNVCTSEGECLTLTSLAWIESAHLAPWVLDFSCNDQSWLKSQRGWRRRSYDGGIAFGAWQIHDPGLLGASPEFQASVALHILRKKRDAWTTIKAAESQAAWTARKLKESGAVPAPE